MGSPPNAPPSGGNAGDVPFSGLVDRIERDHDAHVTAGPSSEEELRETELAIGHLLPKYFRSFLARAGGGLYYQRWELFGTRTVFVHDIELVADIPTQRNLLAARNLPDDWIPFHQCGEAYLFLVAGGGSTDDCPIVDVTGHLRFRGFGEFLHRLVDHAPRTAGSLF
jgi:hypothetical protein